MNLNFEEKEKKFDFIKKLSQLNNEISILIFIEIIKICLEHKNIKNEELSNLKDNIFDNFINKSTNEDYINNIIEYYISKEEIQSMNLLLDKILFYIDYMKQKN